MDKCLNTGLDVCNYIVWTFLIFMENGQVFSLDVTSLVLIIGGICVISNQLEWEGGWILASSSM